VATTLAPSTQAEAAPADEPSEDAPNATGARHRLRHVGALDGLRGVAVLAVVVYHLDERWLPGGFLGVSVFFTLSGFLITNLLLGEWTGTRTIALGTFWNRRFRRLLPAALAGLILATLLSWLWADANQLENLRGDVLAALAYVANWRFILKGDLYGAGFHAPSPVLHYWSLAIEEQFYVVVALIAVVLARFTRHRRAWLVTFGALAALSMLATVRLWGTRDVNRIYFGSDTRAFELLAGVLLAVVIRFRVPTRVLGWSARHVVAMVAALGMLSAFAFAHTAQAWLYHGGFWLVACGSVLLIVGALDSGPLAKGLSWRPLAALGLISYGVYLYHWPIFVFVTHERTGLDGVALVVVRLALTFALAIASYALLEQPVRRGRWHLGLPTVVGAVATVTVVLLVATTLLYRDAATRGVVATPVLALSSTDLTAPTLTEAPASSAVPPPPLQRVLFLGDSLVHQSFPTLSARMTAAGLQVEAIGGEGQHLLWHDDAWRAALDSAMAQFDPQVIVMEACCGWGTPWRSEHVTALDGTDLMPDTPESWREWALEAGVLTDDARAEGRVVLWVLAPPAETNGYYGPIEGRIGVANEIYRGVASCRTGVGFVDWRVIAAPDGQFTWDLPDAQGNAVRVRHPDGLHFTPEGQAVLADVTVRTVLDQWHALAGAGPVPPPTRPCGVPPS
jgi:peptidoglycan/LPS O-acetylase OafA/YrhL